MIDLGNYRSNVDKSLFLEKFMLEVGGDELKFEIARVFIEIFLNNNADSESQQREEELEV